MYRELTILNLNPLDLQISLRDNDIKSHNYLNRHTLAMMPSKNDKAELETAQVSRRVPDNLANRHLLRYQIGVLRIMIARWIINSNFPIYKMNNHNRPSSSFYNNK